MSVALSRDELLKLAMPDLAYLDAEMKWRATARDKQIPPQTEWPIWLLNAGRGFGKTAVGCNWARWKAYNMPGSIGHVVARTSSDLRRTVYEGPAGLLAAIPESMIKTYNRGFHELVLHNGSKILGFSAEEPDRLRGPQCHWCLCLSADAMISMADGSTKPIIDVHANDMVLTRHGPRRVLAQAMTRRNAPTLRLVTDHGSIEATAEHLFLCDKRGWVPLSELQEGDTVCVASPGSGTAARIGISALTGTIATTTANACIDASTPTSMGPSPQSATFTTGTKIAAITALATWKQCLLTTTSGIIAWASRGTPISALRPVPPCPAHGIVDRSAFALSASFAASDMSGDASRVTNGRHLRSALHSVSTAGGAVATSLRSFVSRLSSANPEIAQHVDHGSYPYAPTIISADVPVLSKARVVRKEVSRAQDVYDLTIEGAHEFIANGFVVHNCDELAAWVYVRATWDQVIFSTRLRYVVTEAPPAASQDYGAEPAILRGDDGTILVGPESAPIATPVGKARNAHIKAPNAAVQTRIIEPQIVITTTPRPLPIIRELRNRADVVVTLGSSYENKVNLADSFFKEIIKYEGTVIGRQEIHGELIDPEEAGIVKRSWFKLWPAGTPMPVFDYIVYSLDTAFTEKTWDKKKGESDFSACTVWGVFTTKNTDGKLSRYNIFLIDCWREKYGLPSLIERVKKETAIHYGAARPAIRPRFGESKQRGTGRKADVILIEDKGSGISLRQMLTREHIHTTPYNPGKASKLDRLHAVSHVANSGIVWLPQSETPGLDGQLRQQPKDWIDDWLAEVCTYCGDGSTDYDDYVDSTTQAWRLIADRFLARGVEQKPIEDDVTPPKDNTNPYLR